MKLPQYSCNCLLWMILPHDFECSASCARLFGNFRISSLISIIPSFLESCGWESSVKRLISYAMPDVRDIYLRLCLKHTLINERHQGPEDDSARLNLLNVHDENCLSGRQFFTPLIFCWRWNLNKFPSQAESCSNNESEFISFGISWKPSN